MSYIILLPSSPEGTASSDTILVGNLQLPISSLQAPNTNTTAFPAPPQPNNPPAAPYNMTSSSPQLFRDYSKTDSSSQESLLPLHSTPAAHPILRILPPWMQPSPQTILPHVPITHHLWESRYLQAPALPRPPRLINAQPPCWGPS